MLRCVFLCFFVVGAEQSEEELEEEEAVDVESLLVTFVEVLQVCLFHDFLQLFFS